MEQRQVVLEKGDDEKAWVMDSEAQAQQQQQRMHQSKVLVLRQAPR